MTEFLPWIVGVFTLGLVAFYIWNSLAEAKPSTPPEDRYHHALEMWLDGDLLGATEILHELVHDHPQSIDPYLQLGILLRLQGDPGRAVVLHRGLTVRTDLTRGKKVIVGLALAEDLLDLHQWENAKEVLDTLVRDASGKSRYWKSRFIHWHGMDNQPEAARALQQGMKLVPEIDRPWFSQAYASYQLDRALQHVRTGEFKAAGPRLKDVKKIPEAHSRLILVRAMLAASDNNPADALTLASEELLDSPDELAVFLPMLQHVLLESGQYSRTVPILERACQAEHAPPSLWIDLALLYEKLGHRDKALHLLESKKGSKGLTPDKAAPYLRLLAGEASNTDLAQAWNTLEMPAEIHDWKCTSCGRHDQGIRWFCPKCHQFETYLAQPRNTEAY